MWKVIIFYFKMQSFLDKLKDILKKQDDKQIVECLKASDDDVYCQIYDLHSSLSKSFDSDKTHELFFGPHENPGKKVAQQINELLMPRLIGFRTPSQDLETLKQIQCVSKINLNRLMDLEDTKGMTAFFYRQLGYLEIFGRQNQQDCSKSDDSDSTSVLKSYLDFLNQQDNKTDKLNEKQKLNRLESNSEVKFEWARESCSKQRQKKYAKMTKKLIISKGSLETLICYLLDKLSPEKSFSMCQDLSFEELCHLHHRSLSIKCNDLTNDLAFERVPENDDEFVLQAKTTLLLGGVSQHVEQMTAFAHCLLKQLIQSFDYLTKNQVDLQALDNALPFYDFTQEFFAGAIIPPHFTLTKQPEVTFYQPENIQIEWGDPINISTPDSCIEAHVTFQNVKVVIFCEGKYYIRVVVDGQHLNYSFKRIQKWFKIKKHFDNLPETVSICFLNFSSNLKTDYHFSYVEKECSHKYALGQNVDAEGAWTITYFKNNQTLWQKVLITSHEQEQGWGLADVQVVQGSFRIDLKSKLAVVSHSSKSQESKHFISVFSIDESFCTLVNTIEICPPESGLTFGQPIHIHDNEYIVYSLQGISNSIQIYRLKVKLPLKSQTNDLTAIFESEQSQKDFRANRAEQLNLVLSGKPESLRLNAIQWLSLTFDLISFRLQQIIPEFQFFSPFGISQTETNYNQIGKLCKLFSQLINQLDEMKSKGEKSEKVSSLIQLFSEKIKSSANQLLHLLQMHLKRLAANKDVTLKDFEINVIEFLLVVYQLQRQLCSHKDKTHKVPYFSQAYQLTKQDLKQIFKLEQEALTYERPFCPLFLQLLIEANHHPLSGFKFNYDFKRDQKPTSLNKYVQYVIQKIFQEPSLFTQLLSCNFVQNFVHQVAVNAIDSPDKFKPYLELLQTAYDSKTDDKGLSAMLDVLVTPFALLKNNSMIYQLSNLMIQILQKNTSIFDKPYLPTSKLALKLLKPSIPHDLNQDSPSAQIVQSSLLSGGIEELHLRLLDSEQLKQIVEICAFSIDNDLKKTFERALTDSEFKDECENQEDDLCQELIHIGKSKAIDLILTSIHALLVKKRPFVNKLTQLGSMEVSRAAFAIMAKFSKMLDNIQELKDQVQMELDVNADECSAEAVQHIISQNSESERLFHLWENATKMRIWLAEKKQMAWDRIEQSRKMKQNKEISNEENDELVVSNKIAEIVEKIVKKAEFIIKLKTPDIFEGGKPEDCDSLPPLIKQPTYSKNQESSQDKNNEREDWKEKVFAWKKELEERKQVLNQKELKNSAINTGIQQIIALLQLPVSDESIRKQVETNLLNACRRYAGLQMINLVLENQNIPLTTLQKILKRFCSMQKPQRDQSHYMTDIKGCGINIERRLRTVFFSILAKVVPRLDEANEQEVGSILQSLKWNFMARDFDHMHGSINVFRLFFRNKITESIFEKNFQGWVKNKTSAKDIRLNFEELFYLVLKRITTTTSEAEADTSQSKLNTITRMQSHVDEDASQLLLSQAFNEMFRVFSNFVTQCAELQNSESLIKLAFESSSNQGLIFDDSLLSFKDRIYDELKNNNENEGLNIELSDVSFKEPGDGKESVIQKKIRLQKQFSQEHKERIENFFFEHFFCLIHAFTNVAQISPRPLKMLHKVVANPYHLRTLFELLMVISPLNQIKVLRIVHNLLVLNLPLVVFDEAILSASSKAIFDVFQEGQYLVFIQAFDESSKSGCTLIKFLYAYAFTLRNSQLFEKQKNNYNLSAFLLKTIKKVFQAQLKSDNTLRELENALFALKKTDPNEQELLFEILDSTAFSPTTGNYVAFNRKELSKTMKFEQIFEVESAEHGKVTVYDSHREKFRKLKQADVYQCESNFIATHLHADVFEFLQSYLQTSGTMLQCYILKLLIRNQSQIKDRRELISWLKPRMFEGNQSIAVDVYRLGNQTIGYYQPLLFEEFIAFKRKTQVDNIQVTQPQQKKKTASNIHYKDQTPIERIDDGPDFLLEILQQQPEIVNTGKRTLIKSYYRTSVQAKTRREKMNRAKVLKECYLLLSKAGFVLFDKNQSFVQVRLYVAVRVVYALLGDGRSQFIAEVKNILMGAGKEKKPHLKEKECFERMANKIQKLLEQQSGEDEVLSKVKSTDYCEVDQCFNDLYQAQTSELQKFAKSIRQADETFTARSQIDYSHFLKEIAFPKVISSLYKKVKNGQSKLFTYIEKKQIRVDALLVACLSSALFFDIYSLDQDEDVNLESVEKLAQHYHFVKKNANVNTLELLWLQHPKNYFSSRYHQIMMDLLENKRDLVETWIQKQTKIIQSYQFEASLEPRSLVQVQVFSHHFIGLSRIVAKDQQLFMKQCETFVKLSLREVFMLVFQAKESMRDNDEFFANYSYILARKSFDCLLSIMLKVNLNVAELAQNGKLRAILSSNELELLAKQIPNMLKDTHLKELGQNFNIFIYLAIEVLEVAKRAQTQAFEIGHQLSIPKNQLSTFQQFKKLLTDKKDVFENLQRIKTMKSKKVENQNQQQITEVLDWTKIEFNEESEVELKVNLPQDHPTMFNISGFVAVSKEPCINDSTKFYKVKDKQVKFKTVSGTLYFKHLKNEIFVSCISTANNKVTEKCMCQSEMGGIIPSKLIQGRDVDYWTNQHLMIDSKGKRLFKVDTRKKKLCTEFKLPEHLQHERIKWVSPNHYGMNVYKQWHAREIGEIQNGKTHGEYNTVLMESGAIYLLKNSDDYSWQAYPDLPNKKVADKIAIDDDTLTIVTKDKCLFRCLTYEALNESDKKKYGKALFYMSNFTSKQRDGSSIKAVKDCWLLQVVHNNTANQICKFRSSLLHAELSNGLEGLCASGERSMIGRANEADFPANKSFLLAYENQITKFVKVDVYEGLAMGIDQEGEIWALSGKQSWYLNAGLPPGGQLTNSLDKSLHRRTISFPIKTDFMTKRRAKALDIRISFQQTYVKAVEVETGNQFIMFIHMPKDFNNFDLREWLTFDAIESHFKLGFNKNIDLIDLSMQASDPLGNYSYRRMRNNTTIQSGACLIMRNKNDNSTLQVSHRPLENFSLIEESEEQTKVYSKEAIKVYTKLFEKHSHKKVGAGSNKTYYLKKLFNEMNELEPGLSETVVTEVKELRQNYFDMYRFFIDFFNIARVTAQDTYRLRPKLIYQTDEGSQHVSQKFFEIFREAIKEFQSDYILSTIIDLANKDQRESPYKEVVIDRLKADEFKQLGQTEKPNEFNTVFSQFFVKGQSELFRGGSDGFRVRLFGENAYDAGGPKREVISNICSELMSSVLSLLVPTENNITNFGDFTDCYTLNPNALSQLELEKLDMFGHMIGWSLANKQSLGLDLAPHIWKRLVNGSDVEMTLDDLKKVDLKREEILESIMNCRELPENEFNECYQDIFFEADFGKGQVVQLCDNGSKIPLTKDKIDEYVKCFVQKYFQQDQLQFKVLYRGVEGAVGSLILDLVPEQLAAKRACASKQISFQAIKQQMRFGEKDLKVKLFWCLKQMSNLERSQFLRFMSGASRLVPGESYTIDGMYTEEGDKDKYFPVGHTCGFSIELPNYSTKEIMLEKILKAITLCGEIDDDGAYYGDGGEGEGENDSESSSSEQVQVHESGEEQQDEDGSDADGEHRDGEGEENDGEGECQGEGEDDYGEENEGEGEDDGQGEGEDEGEGADHDGEGEGEKNLSDSEKSSENNDEEEKAQGEEDWESVEDSNKEDQESSEECKQADEKCDDGEKLDNSEKPKEEVKEEKEKKEEKIKLPPVKTTPLFNF